MIPTLNVSAFYRLWSIGVEQCIYCVVVLNIGSKIYFTFASC